VSKEFQQTLVTHLPELRRYALMLTRNGAHADDLMQDAAVRILRYEDHFQVGTNFAAWSRRVLKNLHFSECRKRHLRFVKIDDVSEASLTCPANQEDRIVTGEIIRAMAKLAMPLREVLNLMCGSNISYKEAAKALACTVGTVKSRLWRARHAMKILLADATNVTALPLPATGYIGIDTRASSIA